MATPLDGPDVNSSDRTWGSKFGWVQWKNNQDGPEKPESANATTEQKTLLFTGGENYGFDFDGGFDNAPTIFLYSAVGINSIYAEELTGKTFTPGGQGLPPSPPSPGGRSAIPAPPTAMDYTLFTDGFQNIDSAEFPDYWYSGVDGVQGFVDQN
jgi:hypothetical protein